MSNNTTNKGTNENEVYKETQLTQTIKALHRPFLTDFGVITFVGLIIALFFIYGKELPTWAIGLIVGYGVLVLSMVLSWFGPRTLENFMNIMTNQFSKWVVASGYVKPSTLITTAPPVTAPPVTTPVPVEVKPAEAPAEVAVEVPPAPVATDFVAAPEAFRAELLEKVPSLIPAIDEWFTRVITHPAEIPTVAEVAAEAGIIIPKKTEAPYQYMLAMGKVRNEVAKKLRQQQDTIFPDEEAIAMAKRVLDLVGCDEWATLQDNVWDCWRAAENNWFSYGMKLYDWKFARGLL